MIKIKYLKGFCNSCCKEGHVTKLLLGPESTNHKTSIKICDDCQLEMLIKLRIKKDKCEEVSDIVDKLTEENDE